MDFPKGNQIVDRAIELGLAGIFRNAHLETLKPSQTTTSEHRAMHAVDFPVTALLSIVGTFQDGTTAEITTIGPEGFVEIDAALRHGIAMRTSVCLVGGTAIRLPIGDFQRAIAEYDAFADVVYRAVRVRGYLTEQLAICGIRHTIEQRFARWLLIATYKLQSSSITITQEAISGLLGTRRASISVAAAALQDRGAVAYARGRITIIDRANLEACACECYAECIEAIKAES